MTTLPYGTWPSTINADQLVAGSLRLAEPKLVGETLFWLESRPQEQGRNVVMRQLSGCAPEEILPFPINCRTKANEYGGGSFCPTEDTLYFVVAEDQRIYALKYGSLTPEPVTPEGQYRYADIVFDAHRNRLIAVREDHSQADQEEIAQLVSIDITSGQAQVIASGADFYSSPQLSTDGQNICWLQWDHPAMPWTDNSCFVGTVQMDGTVTDTKAVAGSAAGEIVQSIFQPQWSPQGDLIVVSDRDNWWRLYTIDTHTNLSVPLLTAPPANAEFGTPQWVFGLSTWGFINDREIIATYTSDGRDFLARIDTENRTWSTIESDWTSISYVAVGKNCAAVQGANHSRPDAIARLYNENLETVVQVPSSLADDALSQPQSHWFGPQDKRAQGFYYPAFNNENTGPEDETPPLIVLAHGGPTSRTSTALNIKIQYWCSRGFAVMDVNYRGSTGFGRDYRLALDGNWGVSDVEDVCHAAEYLVEQGLADPERLAIKGGSAGGFTVLAALTFANTFKAGCSLYGVGNLETLVADTHKFESRYLDSLVGPYPETKERYLQRSPINSVSQLNCPVIFFQGSEDKVVPPNQAETMVAALKEKGLPVAYVLFEGEGHGFRQAKTIVDAIEGELYFYSQVFGFEPAQKLPAVPIFN